VRIIDLANAGERATPSACATGCCMRPPWQAVSA
jgi:hypothetical protein